MGVQGAAASDPSVAVLACGTRGAQKVETTAVDTRVLCRAHALVSGHREARLVHCKAAPRVRWTCDGPVRAMLRRIGDRDFVLTRDPQIAPRVALEVVRFATQTYDHTFNGRDLAAMISGVCHVGHEGAPFDGAESFEIACGSERLTITRDCWQGRCRLYPAALGLPPR